MKQYEELLEILMKKEMFKRLQKKRMFALNKMLDTLAVGIVYLEDSVSLELDFVNRYHFFHIKPYTNVTLLRQ